MGFHFHTVHTGSAIVAAIEYPLKSFGKEGVNLFFTLSGFLVGGLLLKQYAKVGRIDARRFIIRRIFKIWPAYYVLILFHVFAGRHPTSTFLVQNLTHMQNYLGSSITQTWSLAVEEHFYLFLPALLLLVDACSNCARMPFSPCCCRSARSCWRRAARWWRTAIWMPHSSTRNTASTVCCSA